MFPGSSQTFSDWDVSFISGPFFCQIVLLFGIRLSEVLVCGQISAMFTTRHWLCCIIIITIFVKIELGSCDNYGMTISTSFSTFCS